MCVQISELAIPKWAVLEVCWYKSIYATWITEKDVTNVFKNEKGCHFPTECGRQPKAMFEKAKVGFESAPRELFLNNKSKSGKLKHGSHNCISATIFEK